MELSGKVSIQALAELTSLQGYNMFPVAVAGSPYVSYRTTYGSLSGQIYRDVGGKIKDEIRRDTLEYVTDQLRDSVGAVSAMELRHAAEISALSSDLVELSVAHWRLKEQYKELSGFTKKLSDFTRGDLVAAVLKIANCQLSVKIDLSSIRNDLSVKVVSF